jgi:hypothetical protein
MFTKVIASDRYIYFILTHWNHSLLDAGIAVTRSRFRSRWRNFNRRDLSVSYGGKMGKGCRAHALVAFSPLHSPFAKQVYPIRCLFFLWCLFFVSLIVTQSSDCGAFVLRFSDMTHDLRLCVSSVVRATNLLRFQC